MRQSNEKINHQLLRENTHDLMEDVLVFLNESEYDGASILAAITNLCAELHYDVAPSKKDFLRLMSIVWDHTEEND